MTQFPRLWTLALAASLVFAACSHEEPPAPPAPAAPAKPVAPPPAAAAPAAKPAEGADARLTENPTAEEPGFLTAFADSSETVGKAPLTVKLNVDVVDNTGHPPYTFTWDFGDATDFSTDKSPNHVYKIPGSFRASVIIRDSKGEIDQDYIDISVSDPNAPQGMTAEQLMQQVPLEEVLRQAREGAAKKAAEEGAPAPGKAPAPAKDGEE